MEWAWGKDIFAPIVVAVVLAALGSGWLKLAPKGQKYWDTLGTFRGPVVRPDSYKVEGIRTLFVVAALGLVTALAALSAGLFASRPKGTVSFYPILFGQNGSSRNGHDPGGPITGSSPASPKTFGASVDEFPICGFMEIKTEVAIKTEAAGASCKLSPPTPPTSGEWQIVVTDHIACSVVCYHPVSP